MPTLVVSIWMKDLRKYEVRETRSGNVLHQSGVFKNLNNAKQDFLKRMEENDWKLTREVVL